MKVRLSVFLVLLIISGGIETSVHSQESSAPTAWQFLGPALNYSKEPVFAYVDASPHGFAPAVAATSKLVYVAYTEFNYKGVTEVRVKDWDGQAWSKRYTILNKDGTLNAFDPAIAVAGGVPYVAWTEKDDNQNPVLYATHLAEIGWLRPKGNLNVNPDYRATSPVLAAVNGVLHLIWTEGAETTPQHLYLRRLSEGTWGEAGDILNVDPGQDAYEPSFALDGDTGYLAWSERDSEKIMRIHVRKVLKDGAPVLGGPILAEGQGHAVSPTIAVFGGKPYVAWIEPSSARSTQIALASLENGAWVKDPNVSNGNPTANALSPVLIPGKDSLYLGWTETAQDGTPRIHLRRLKDDAWSPAAPILPVEFSHMASTPALARDGLGILAAWKQDNDMGVFKIRVARLPDKP